nr:hypothetical protein [uncultured Albidiferax sp.]
MSLLCPACQTLNASGETVCIHCAAALPPPAPQPVPQRMSLLEQAMTKPTAKPVTPPVPPPPVPPPPATPVPLKAAPVTAPAPMAAVSPPPAPKAAPAHSGFTMPPLPPQPRPRRRSRTPWILAIVLMLALMATLGYEALQANGVSLPSLRSLLPASTSSPSSP